MQRSIHLFFVSFTCLFLFSSQAYAYQAAISTTTTLTPVTTTSTTTTLPIFLSVDDVTDTEGTDLLFTVTLDNEVQAGAFTVDVNFADVSATGGTDPLVTPEDYDNDTQTLNFVGTAGETQQFTVSTLDDAVLESVFESFKRFKVLAADILNAAPQSKQLSELSEAEISQIKYWKPRRLGEIAFNHWD